MCKPLEELLREGEFYYEKAGRMRKRKAPLASQAGEGEGKRASSRQQEQVAGRVLKRKAPLAGRREVHSISGAAVDSRHWCQKQDAGTGGDGNRWWKVLACSSRSSGILRKENAPFEEEAERFGCEHVVQSLYRNRLCSHYEYHLLLHYNYQTKGTVGAKSISYNCG